MTDKDLKRDETAVVEADDEVSNCMDNPLAVLERRNLMSSKSLSNNDDLVFPEPEEEEFSTEWPEDDES